VYTPAQECALSRGRRALAVTAPGLNSSPAVMVITVSIFVAAAVLAAIATRRWMTTDVRMEPISQWWLARQRNQDLAQGC
jgi:hypothetical protein